MSSKHILITGSTGLVGYALINQLVEKGYHPLLLIRSESSVNKFKHLQDKITALIVDFTDSKSLNQLVKEVKKNYRLHATIYALGATQASNAQAYNFVNAEILKSILIVFKNNNVSLGKVIFVSSLSLHGPNEDINYEMNITTPFNPLTDYAKSKVLAETFLQAHSNNYIIIRPAAIFGQYDKQMVIIHRLIKRGWFIHLGSKENKVGVIHAKDLATHILFYLESEQKNIIVTSCTHNVFIHKYFDAIANAYGVSKKITLIFPKWIIYLLAVVNEFFGRFFLRKIPVFNKQKVAELVGKNWSCNTQDFTSTLNIPNPTHSFEQRVKETADWYLENQWV